MVIKKVERIEYIKRIITLLDGWLNSQTSGGVAFRDAKVASWLRNQGCVLSPFFFLQGQNNHTHTYKIIEQH